jgi:hypothetical protein
MAMTPRYTSGPKKGQFKPRAKARKGKARRRRKLGAAKKGTRRTMARKRSSKGGKRRARRRSAGSSRLMTRAKVAGWTAVYGYLKEQRNTFKDVPKVDAIGQDATMMVVAHLAAKHGPRIVRGPLDSMATGLAGVVGYRLGASGFKLSSIQGPGDDGDLVGAVDPSDFLAENLPDAAV